MSAPVFNRVVASGVNQELAEDDSVDGPPAKRRRLDIDPPRLGNRYENATAQGNSRNVYGNYTNTNTASNTTNNTYNVYPQPSTSTPVPQAEAQGQAPDTATGLREALLFDEMDERYSTISSAYPKTCRWLFKTEKYKIWQDKSDMRSHQGFLWIKGKPGAGKSTVMKVAYDHGMRVFKEDAIVSFFFNARGTQLQRCAEGMYRSLLHQLLREVPGLPAMELNIGQQGHQRVWHVEQLKNMFREAVMAMGSTKLTCYVDALDECQDDEAQDMIEFFETLSELAMEKHVGFRVLLSSRHYPHIMIKSCLELILDGQEGHELDIADYTRNKLQIGTSKAAQDIRDEIQRKASGIFLWVVLVIRILNKAKSQGRVSQLKARLRELPVDLHQLFERILQRDSFDDSDRKTVLLTFQWLLFAQRPLKREELYFAVTTSMDEETIEAWDPDEVSTKDMERFILDSSRGLAEMSKGKQPTTQFIHESVRDYLLESGLKVLDPDLPSNLSGSCHDRLKDCCHHYLTRCEPVLLPSPTDGLKDHLDSRAQACEELKARTKTTHPFLGYALAGLISHADSACCAGLIQGDFIIGFPCKLWSKLYNLTTRYHAHRLSKEVTHCYIFALMGARTLTEHSITDDQLNKYMAHEQHRSLLGAAVNFGDDRLVSMLLERGANPHSIANNDEDCLFWAVRKGNPAMVRCLFGHPTAAVRGLPYPESNLRAAIQKGNADILEIILANRFVAAQLCSSALPALEDAAIPGHEEVLRSLLRFLDLVSVLFHAVLYDRHDIVQLLLAYSINLDAKDEESHTALISASLTNSSKCVRVLIDNGAQIDLQDEKGYTALHHASELGHEDIVRMLLSGGADVNVHDDHTETALSKASKHGHRAIVQILLDKGAQINLQDDKGYTALHHASELGHEDIARMLLGGGADVNVHDDHTETALSKASKHGHRSMVQMLLDKGADVNSRGSDGLSVLSMEIEHNHPGNVRLLLYQGADANLRSIDGTTMLAVAVERGYSDIAQILLHYGAHPFQLR